MGKSKRQLFIDLARKGGSRQDFIDLARSEGVTSAEDMKEVAKAKKASEKIAKVAKKGLKAIPGVGVAMEIFEPTELGAAERPLSEEQMSEINQMEEYKKGGRVKKAKGGLIKGFPKVAKRGY
mgnify:CR=1 FL=1|jgi:hypothetical protein